MNGASAPSVLTALPPGLHKFRRRDCEAKPVRLAFRWRPRLPDPGDEMVLETAVNGNANAIVTFNQRHFEEAARNFHCAVILPRVALRRIRSSHP
jgi:hypothetical protein